MKLRLRARGGTDKKKRENTADCSSLGVVFLVGAAHTCPKATETASIVPGADLITALYLSPRR